MTVWTPFIDGRLVFGLAVPFLGTTSVNRQRYEDLLQDRLEDLMSADPKWAKDLLTVSPEHHPNLYDIALYNPPKHCGNSDNDVRSDDDPAQQRRLANFH